jgi:hypothetical protein
MAEIVQNFVIKDGRVFDLNGDQIVGQNGIWKPRGEDSEKRVVKSPRMRWKDGSFLTEQQRADEDYQTKLRIA